MIVKHQEVSLMPVFSIKIDPGFQERCVEVLQLYEEDAIVAKRMTCCFEKLLRPASVLVAIITMEFLCAPWVSHFDHPLSVELLHAKHCEGMVVG